MAGTVNKVILIGNLGKDPEVRVLENGVKLVRFPIATSESYVDKATGERRVVTDWHNIVLWRGLADVASKYLSKGQKIYVEGKLKTRSWTDEMGVKKYSTEVVGDNMTMLSSKGEFAQSENLNSPDFSSEGTPNSPEPLSDNLMEDSNDDLPF